MKCLAIIIVLSLAACSFPQKRVDCVNVRSYKSVENVNSDGCKQKELRAIGTVFYALGGVFLLFERVVPGLMVIGVGVGIFISTLSPKKRVKKKISKCVIRDRF